MCAQSFEASGDPLQQGPCGFGDGDVIVPRPYPFESPLWKLCFHQDFSLHCGRCTPGQIGMQGLMGRLGTSHRAKSDLFRLILARGRMGVANDDDVAWILKHCRGGDARKDDMDNRW